MATERVMWTALPNGPAEDGTGLRVTVYVTPRLRVAPSDDGVLGEFPAFKEWPETLADVKFSIKVQGGPTLPASPDPDSSEPDLDIWKLLFPNRMPVETRQFEDLSDRTLRSFPYDEVLERVGDFYSDVAAASPTEFPDLRSISHRLGRLGRTGGNPDAFYGPIDELFMRTSEKGGGVVDRTQIGAGQAEQLAFAQTYRFYDRPGTQIGPNDPVPKLPPKPKIDFHAACNFLADYPELLRRLGLAIDLVIDDAIPDTGRLRVNVSVPAGLAWMKDSGMRPWTRYLQPPGRFLAEPRKQGDLNEGMLDLAGDLFVLGDLDVDGSGMKYVDFASTAFRLLGRRASGDPDGISLPALHNSGITVARRNRALGIAQQIAAASDKDSSANSGTPVELYADDLTRGYRVDVFDDASGEWRSLCRREGVYQVDRAQSVTLDIDPDEGYIKGASTTEVPDWVPGADSDLYLHEAVFGWDGWSLVAPRPGRAAQTHPNEDIDPETKNPCALTTSFKPVDGSLPPLRFGHNYSLRARAVDLAGNSFDFDDPGVPGTTDSPPLNYRRWDPVPAPAVVARRPFTEGEALMRMVLRSTLGKTAAAYRSLARVKNLPGHEKKSGKDQLDRSYRDRDERHIAPPKSSLQLAETHGLLDPVFGDRPQPTRNEFFAIAEREAGTLMDVKVSDPADPSVVHTLDYVDVVNQAEPPTKLPLPERGTPLKEGEYVVHDTDELLLPYLPDHLARGAALKGLPAHPGVWKQAFAGTWPDRKPFEIRLVEGTAAPKWNATKRRLTVSLPKAEVAHVRLSCHLEGTASESDLDLFAIWRLLPASIQKSLRQRALDGQHWMLTPPDELVLVHAVERPLEPPKVLLGYADMERLPGETFVVLNGTLAVHAKSSGRLDIESEWTEPIDDLARSGPEDVDGASHVADFQIERTEDTVQLARDDTAPGVTPSTHKARHEFGDTKHRLVTYRSIATTRFREYFPPEITNDPALITHDGPRTDVHVPSSRRPDPPEVLYVVPTFRWDEDALPAISPVRGRGRFARGEPTLRRTRRGGGLRVYVDRPWYSSGADEQLAVVLPNQKPPISISDLYVEVERALEQAGIDRTVFEAAARRLGVKGATPAKIANSLIEAVGARVEASGTFTNQLADALVLDTDLISVLFKPDVSKFVTHWGMDPIWGAEKPPRKAPRIQSFTNADSWDTDLTLVEVPFSRVAVAAYDPHYDPDRRLWYFDIDVEPGDAYFPFIRLALARYQPYSIPGTELSRVVLAEYSQLTPDRTATIRSVRKGGGVSISLTGVAGINDISDRVVQPDDPEALGDSRLVVAQAQELRTASGTDLDWQPAGPRVTLHLSGGTRPDVRWSGIVPLPGAERGYEYRVALEEYELYETDESQQEFYETTLSDPVDIKEGRDFIAHGIMPLVKTPIRGRLIYADHFALVRDDEGGLRPEL